MPQSSWAGCIAGSETFLGRLQWEIVRTLRHRGLRKSYALAMSRFQILGTAAGGLTLHAMSLFPEPRRDGTVVVRLHWGICRNVFFLFFGGWLEFKKSFHHLSSSICIINFINFHHFSKNLSISSGICCILAAQYTMLLIFGVYGSELLDPGRPVFFANLHGRVW